MQDFCLQGVRPDTICQAKHPEACQNCGLIGINMDRKDVGAYFGADSNSRIKTGICWNRLKLAGICRVRLE